MKRITPIGYSKSSMGKALSIMTIIIGAAIIFTLLQNGALLFDMLIPALVMAALAVAFWLVDSSLNKKNRSKIEHMEYMLSCPFVKGELVNIKQIPYFFGKEIEEPIKTKGKVYINGKHSVYRIVASFYSPVTDRDEVVTSVSYNYSALELKKKGSIKIHYSPEGEYWVEAEI